MPSKIHTTGLVLRGAAAGIGIGAGMGADIGAAAGLPGAAVPH
ncbi:MAG TPA: hypothetical protein VN736_02205 [Candidatus Limnocylindrales bacterium]|nr:hypothetical protein [Candidatus Limnocylindrales bacterium]